jgi:hypothetical protein
MLIKVYRFIRYQRSITKVAVITAVLSLALTFIAFAQSSSAIMLVAAGVSGFAAGAAISAWHRSPRRNPPDDRRSTGDRRHHEPEPVGSH